MNLRDTIPGHVYRDLDPSGCDQPYFLRVENRLGTWLPTEDGPWDFYDLYDFDLGPPIAVSPEEVEALLSLGTAEEVEAFVTRLGADAPATPTEKAPKPEAHPSEAVERPSHYLLPGGREALLDVVGPVCDALAGRGLPGSVVYSIGNALKYLCRAGAKGSAVEDLQKAREYLGRAIERLGAEK